MTLEVFIMGLTICSAATMLVTEAVKKMLENTSVKYNSNILAAICSVLVAVITTVVYGVLAKPEITAQFIVLGILLMIFSWIGAMVGYDKVVQTIRQILEKKEN